MELLGTGTLSRNNSKTNEVDRAGYYYDGKGINDSENGIAGVSESMNQISLQENVLIWAEALLRDNTSNFGVALNKLNEHGFKVELKKNK